MPERAGFKTLEPFEQKKAITNQPVPLEKLPMEPKEDVYQSAAKIFAATPDASTPTVKLTVGEVKANALAQNLGLKVDRLSAAMAEELFTAEKWKFEPRLSAALQQTGAHDVNTDRSVTTIFQPSLRIPNHLGGEVTLGLPITHVDSQQISSFDYTTGFPVPIRQGEIVTAGPEISIHQPLLRDAWLRATYASVDTAGLRARQAEARSKLAAIRLVAGAEQTYWRYYAAYEALRIQLRKYELAKDQLRFAKRLVEEGVRTKVEVTRAEAGVAREFDGVITAELQRRQAERGLKRIISSPDLQVGAATVIQPATLPAPTQLDFDRSAVLKVAFDKRMDLLDNELEIAIAETQENVAWNQQLPGLAFDFKYSYAGIKSNLTDSLDQAFKHNASGYVAGLTLDLPVVLDRAASARERQALLALRQTRASRENLRLAVEEEVLNAIDAVELGWQQVLASRQSMALASEAYEADKVQFGNGTITSTDLLIQLDALSSAQLAYVRALSDHHNSLVDLAFATGTVLSESGIIWSKDD